MTGSFIHSAFDPLPYLVFSLISIVAGLLLEVRAAVTRERLPSRFFPCASIWGKSRLGGLLGFLILGIITR